MYCDEDPRLKFTKTTIKMCLNSEKYESSAKYRGPAGPTTFKAALFFYI